MSKVKLTRIQHLEENGDHYILDCTTGEWINPVSENPHDAFVAVCNAGGMGMCDNVETLDEGEDADSFWPNANAVEERTVEVG